MEDTKGKFKNLVLREQRCELLKAIMTDIATEDSLGDMESVSYYFIVNELVIIYICIYVYIDDDALYG